MSTRLGVQKKFFDQVGALCFCWIKSATFHFLVNTIAGYLKPDWCANRVILAWQTPRWLCTLISGAQSECKQTKHIACAINWPSNAKNAHKCPKGNYTPRYQKRAKKGNLFVRRPPQRRAPLFSFPGASKLTLGNRPSFHSLRFVHWSCDSLKNGILISTLQRAFQQFCHSSKLVSWCYFDS